MEACVDWDSIIRYNDAGVIGMPKEPRLLADRFWEKVAFLGAGTDDCWEWQGAKRKRNGYGAINEGGPRSRTLQAHRVAWEFAYGAIPVGMCVLHRCDNPSCVNPRHLFLGTKLDNSHDMMNKDRAVYVRGERHGVSKLIEQEIHEIRHMRSRGISQRVTAKKYGIDHSNVSLIETGKTWGWLKEEVGNV